MSHRTSSTLSFEHLRSKVVVQLLSRYISKNPTNVLPKRSSACILATVPLSSLASLYFNIFHTCSRFNSTAIAREAFSFQ